jgi:uncharacterized C2H2 Zn-finger protein
MTTQLKHLSQPNHLKQSQKVVIKRHKPETTTNSAHEKQKLKNEQHQHQSQTTPHSTLQLHHQDHLKPTHPIKIKEEPQNPPNPIDILILDIIKKKRKKTKKLEKIPRWLKVPKDTTLTCDYCSDTFDIKSKLIFHIKNHVAKSDTNTQCQICAKTFTNRHFLQIHMMSHDDTLLPCAICGKQVKPQCLVNHVRQVHTTVKVLACEICGKAFKTKQNLREHQKYHNKAFQCELCGRNFARSTDLNDHMVGHESPESLRCGVCGVQLADPRALKKHVVKMHVNRVNGAMVVEKKFKCGLCEYACSVQNNLKVHMKKHERFEAKCKANPDAIRCEPCSSVFGSELLLKMHNMKVHSDERFPCGHCDKVLKTKNSMWNHVRKVHGMEPERTKKEKMVKAVVDGAVEAGKKPRRKRRKRNEAGELVDRDDDEEIGVEVIEIGEDDEVEYY